MNHKRENKNMNKAGIIGFGNIGKKLYEKLLENGWIVILLSRENMFC